MLIIKTNFLSYWNIHQHFKFFLKYIYYFFYLLKTLTLNLKFNLTRFKELKKIFTFVKSPKCYKRGKRLYKFSYFKYQCKITINSYTIEQINLFLTFFFFKQIVSKLSTTYFFQYKTSIKLITILNFLDVLC